MKYRRFESPDSTGTASFLLKKRGMNLTTLNFQEPQVDCDRENVDVPRGV